MVNKGAYDVSFVGQDYQSIRKAANSMKITLDGEEFIIDSEANICQKDESNTESDQQCARYILDFFLNEVAPNGYCNSSAIIVNSSQGKNKKLYDVDFGAEGDKGYFCGVVGVVRKPVYIKLDDENDESVQFNITLQIKSRLDVNCKNEVSKPYFLSTMLLRDKVKLSNNTIPSNEDEIFDYLLLFWFIERLERACLKGYYKTYRRFEGNDDKVKGTLDIARHIRLNMGQKNGRIAYSYRENTINNYLNQLIVAAYNHLKNKYYDLVEDNFDSNDELKNIITFLTNETDFSNTNTKAVLKNNLKTISHPYFTEYEELRLICLRILRDEGISIFDGESNNGTQGILFYLPELWEKYLENKLIKNALPENVTVKSQFEIRNFGCKQSAGSDYEFKQRTYPDYVFFYNDKPFMILDAKCKPKWEDAAKGGSVSDVMEDYNKCIRDMVAANSHATGVIFPTNRTFDMDNEESTAGNISDRDNVEKFCHQISEFNNTDFFYTIPVYIPFVEKTALYSDWTNQFENVIQNEINIINGIVQKEVEFAKENLETYESIKRKSQEI